MTTETPTSSDEHDRVRERYALAAQGGGCCDGGTCCLTYKSEELLHVPSGADLGLGSGAPLRFAELRSGETAVDLGSGAGVDVFLAGWQVGPAGRAIGVDMTPEMLDRARRLAREAGRANVEFREGLIERPPVEDGVADAVTSNCVINLSPDKPAVFREALRVLRPGGRLVISDIVKERAFAPGIASCGCVDGAMLRDQYFETIRGAGFENLEILEERPWFEVEGERLATSVTLRARKPMVQSRTSGAGLR